MIRVTAFHYTANSILIKRVGKSKRGLICRRRAKEEVSAEKGEESHKGGVRVGINDASG